MLVRNPSTNSGETHHSSYNTLGRRLRSLSPPTTSRWRTLYRSAFRTAAQTGTVTLSLSGTIRQGQAVVVTYTDPTAGDDAVAIEDAAGNETGTFTTGINGDPPVTNGSTVAPVPTSAAVAADGNSLTVTFDESVDQTNLPAAGTFSVAADGAPVTVSGVSAGTAAQLVLALAAPGITAGQVVTLGYTDPTAGDDTNAVQDTSGNDAVSFSGFSVTNNSTVDTTPPSLVSATVNTGGTRIGLEFSEMLELPSTSTELNTFVATLPAAFAVTADSATRAITALTATQTGTVTLRISLAIRQGQAVVVTYTDPTAGDDAVAIEDAAGNETATFTTGMNRVPAVTNTSTLAPVPTSAAVAADGNSITVTFDESVDQTNLPAAGTFSVAADGAPVTVSGVSAGTAAQLVLALAAPGIGAGQVVTLGYTDPTDRRRHQRRPGHLRQRRRILLRLLRHQQRHRRTPRSADNWSALTANTGLARRRPVPACCFSPPPGATPRPLDIHGTTTPSSPGARRGRPRRHPGLQHGLQGESAALPPSTATQTGTLTTYTTTAKGVPIYWLGGTKAADVTYDRFLPTGTGTTRPTARTPSGTDGHDTFTRPPTTPSPAASTTAPRRSTAAISSGARSRPIGSVIVKPAPTTPLPATAPSEARPPCQKLTVHQAHVRARRTVFAGGGHHLRPR